MTEAETHQHSNLAMELYTFFRITVRIFRVFVYIYICIQLMAAFKTSNKSTYIH